MARLKCGFVPRDPFELHEDVAAPPLASLMLSWIINAWWEYGLALAVGPCTLLGAVKVSTLAQAEILGAFAPL